MDGLRRVLVRGEGIAGSTVAALLFSRGIPVTRLRKTKAADARGGRIIAVPMATVKLVADLWDVPASRLFTGRVVTGRNTAWEARHMDRVAFPALVCDTAILAARLGEELDARGVPATTDESLLAEQGSLLVQAIGNARQSKDAIVGGARIAVIGRADHLAEFDESAITISACAGGWLFAAPHPEAGVALMLVRPHADQTAASCGDLRDAVSEVFGAKTAAAHVQEMAIVPCAPALAPALVETGLVVGDAVLSLDPIRGDGLGFAARGALLAQAVIAAAAGRALLDHYAARLTSAFVHHVELAAAHYRRAFNAPLWTIELNAMAEASTRAADRIAGHVFAFRLDGSDLRPRRTGSDLTV